MADFVWWGAVGVGARKPVWEPCSFSPACSLRGRQFRNPDCRIHPVWGEKPQGRGWDLAMAIPTTRLLCYLGHLTSLLWA